MRSVVIDSSILLASVLLDEPLTTEAQQLLFRWVRLEVTLIAPRLFRYELAAVIRKAVFQNRISAEYGAILLDEVLAYPIAFYGDNDLMKRAYGIALQHNMPRTYDAQYLALAERLLVLPDLVVLPASATNLTPFRCAQPPLSSLERGKNRRFGGEVFITNCMTTNSVRTRKIAVRVLDG